MNCSVIILLCICANMTIASKLPVLQIPLFKRLEQLFETTLESSGHSKHNATKLKIVGGIDAQDGEAPHQIALFISNHFTCGGSFISAQAVVTAAHCVYGKENKPSAFKVIYGALDRTKGLALSVSNIIRHPGYSDISLTNDVAVLHLSSAFNPGTNAAVIPLAESSPPTGSNMNVTGWGRLSAGGTLPTNLQIASSLQVMNKTECAARWSIADIEITDAMLCVHSASQSSCNGDSGGPLTYNGELVGIVSWGESRCLHQYYPSVYGNVAHLKSWIMANSATKMFNFWPIILVVILFSIVNYIYRITH